MKTIDQLKSEIKEIQAIYAYPPDHAPKDVKKAGERVKFLRDCIMYLESEPTEEFVKKMEGEVECKVEDINLGFNLWLAYNPENKLLKNPQSAYENQFELPKLKNQLKTLKFILAE